MKGTLIALAMLASATAVADSQVYVCKDATGKKAIRDTPCEAGEQMHKEVTAKTHQPPTPGLFESLDNVSRNSNCRMHRSAAASASARYMGATDAKVQMRACQTSRPRGAGSRALPLDQKLSFVSRGAKDLVSGRYPCATASLYDCAQCILW